MARKYAQIKVTVWDDDDFLDLSMAEQWLYLHLATAEGMSYAGVQDWRPRRIVPKAMGMTLEEVQIAAQVLEVKRYIIVDEDTEEVMVRSFIRNDGLLKQKNMGAAVDKAYSKIGSRLIKGVVVYELNRLRAENPAWPSWDALMDVLARRSINPFENPSGKGSVNPSPSPLVEPSANPIGEPSF